MQVPFALQSYAHDSLPLGSQRAINAFAEAQPEGSKYPVAVFGIPGISTFTTCGDGPIRGMFAMNGFGYCVSGADFYRFTSAGVALHLGTGITGGGAVSIDGNGTQIAIANGSTIGFIYNSNSAAFTQINDPDFHGGNTVAFIDNYFAFDWLGTRKVYVSALLNGLAYDPLAFATKESKPDRVLALRNRQNALLVLAENSIELWTNIGTTPFPFARFDGGTVNRGIGAAYAVAEEDNALFFLGEDIVFYRLNGVQTQRISTHAIERAWQKYTTISDAFCYAINDRGHKFIFITFPSASATWVYDIATNLWHERISYDSANREVRYRVNSALFAFNMSLVGDAYSGKIGLIDPTIYTEFGDPIRTVLTSPPVHGDGKIVFMDKFELDVETGVGLATGQGSDPQVMLDWSDDGGRTWVPPQPWRTMGKVGNYLTRIQWQGLGNFYQRTLRISMSDPVKRVILAARADVRIGTQ